MAAISASDTSGNIVPPKEDPKVAFEFVAVSQLEQKLRGGGSNNDVRIKFGKDPYILFNGEKYSFQMTTTHDNHDLYEEKDSSWVQVGSFSRKLSVVPPSRSSASLRTFRKAQQQEKEQLMAEKKSTILSVSDCDGLTGTKKSKRSALSSYSSSSASSSLPSLTSLSSHSSHSSHSSSHTKTTTTTKKRVPRAPSLPSIPAPSEASTELPEWSVEDHAIHLLAIRARTVNVLEQKLKGLGFSGVNMEELVQNVARKEGEGTYYLKEGLFREVYPDDYPYSASEVGQVKSQLKLKSIPCVRWTKESQAERVKRDKERKEREEKERRNREERRRRKEEEKREREAAAAAAAAHNSTTNGTSSSLHPPSHNNSHSSSPASSPASHHSPTSSPHSALSPPTSHPSPFSPSSPRSSPSSQPSSPTFTHPRRRTPEDEHQRLVQKYTLLGEEIERSVKELAVEFSQSTLYKAIVAARGGEGEKGASPQQILSLIQQTDVENVLIERGEFEKNQRELKKKGETLKRKREEYGTLREQVVAGRKRMREGAGRKMDGV